MEEVITLTMEEKTRCEVIRDSLKRLIKVKEKARAFESSCKANLQIKKQSKKRKT